MLDYLAIFRKMNEAKVRYAVAGGLAVNLHGIPRMTYDIDLIVDLEDANLTAFTDLLVSWGFKPRAPVSLSDFAVQEKRKDWIENKHMKALNLVNPKWAISEIDVLIDLPISLDEALNQACIFNLDGIPVPTVSLEHLITMKMGTGRAQDKADVEHLKRIQERQP